MYGPRALGNVSSLCRMAHQTLIVPSTVAKPSPERSAEIHESLAEIRSRIQAVSSDSRSTTLVAVSKYKDASDVLACYEGGQRDFGENYLQELVDKAAKLPQDIRWHFIGALQSKKGKDLAAIPNLYAIHSVTSTKAAKILNAAIKEKRILNVLLQVNTSGEESKSGLPPFTSADSELIDLAKHIITECDHLHLQGLMTIGSLAQSLSTSENKDFETLTTTREGLQSYLNANRDVMQKMMHDRLNKEGLGEGRRIITWGKDGRLLLSMGMSSDFETALKAGSDIVRVGTGIFGERPKKGGAN